LIAVGNVFDFVSQTWLKTSVSGLEILIIIKLMFWPNNEYYSAGSIDVFT